ncbi:hypothetical protein P5G62_023405 [Neobacillus sp. 179-C4.2 HS]|uniref:Uncharacterized protein n=1 Tax=Neobacillus driksii TaxID=3035913 RepID=A0ABV4YYX6_9BACI|nr:hypothetical protein [Neobacillus sp. 179.-C4.2 HS]MDP5194641.1 hypothetical protein [Neobacillus sp. 179.-C4.2 HS]
MIKLIFAMFFIVVVVVVTTACATDDNIGHVGKDYLVGYEEGASPEEVKSIIEKNSGTILKHYSNLRVYKVNLKKADAVKIAKEELIRYVEEDKIAEIK